MYCKIVYLFLKRPVKVFLLSKNIKILKGSNLAEFIVYCLEFIILWNFAHVFYLAMTPKKS